MEVNIVNDRVERLYQIFGILADSSDSIAEHEKEYREILDAVKGSTKEKRLASQFIIRFFRYFPALTNEALDALFDLCEDDDMSIRKKAIKDLSHFCQENIKLSSRIADALTQLLQAEDNHELSIVQNSLLELFQYDPKGALLGLFNQIKNGDDRTREKGLKFIQSKFIVLNKYIAHPEIEDLLIVEIKKVYQDANSEEMPIILGILSKTKLGKTPQGYKEIVEFVIEQLELETPFDITDDVLVESLTVSVNHITSYFSSTLDSNRYVKYFCDEIIPKIKNMQGFQDGAQNVVEILKIIAECTTYCTTLPNFEKSLTSLYDLLIELLPLPEGTENDHINEPKLQFTYVECLLYSLHRLCRHYPDWFEDHGRLKLFRKRLQYFARALQGYIKTLHNSLQGKTKEELNQQDNKLKAVALRTTSNINVLIKDFFHSPPIYKSSIIPSWKMFRKVPPNTEPVIGKRRLKEVSFDLNPSIKMIKADKIPSLELYHPPNGKYSSLITQSVNKTKPRPPLRGSLTRGSFRRARQKIGYDF